jgi:hypothetical protein
LNCINRFDDLDEFVADRVERSIDKLAAIKELDGDILKLYNWALTASMFIKQKYVVPEIVRQSGKISKDDLQYTKQEVAIKYKVSMRTVGNWIMWGLEVTKVSGVVRISRSALESFVMSSKAKKFNWISAATRVTT